MTPSNLAEQTTSIRAALSHFPDERARFDKFEGEIDWAVKNRPDEASRQLLEWMKTVTIPELNTKEETNTVVSAIEQAIFCSPMLNYSSESFRTFRWATISPLLQLSEFRRAACKAWEEFVSIFAHVWGIDTSEKMSHPATCQRPRLGLVAR